MPPLKASSNQSVSVQQFIDECCEGAPVWTPCGIIYAAYEKWAAPRYGDLLWNHRASLAHFGRILCAKYPPKILNNQRGYCGIRLRA